MSNVYTSTITGVGSEDFLDNYSKFVECLAKVSWGNLQLAYNGIGEGPMTLCALGLLTALSRNSELNTFFEPFLGQFSTFMENADASALKASASYGEQEPSSLCDHPDGLKDCHKFNCICIEFQCLK